MENGCDCACHQSTRGDYNDAFQRGDWHVATSLAYDPSVNVSRIVPENDPLEAAVACDLCRRRHVRALSDMPDFLPPQDWQADGADEG